MTTCLYGSEPQSGAPAYFTIPQATIAVKFGVVAGWLTNWAMGLSDGPYETAAFCSTEPIGDLPTLADYALLASPPLALLAGTYQRFGNQLKAEMFAEYCQCLGVPFVSCNDVPLTFYQRMSRTPDGAMQVPMPTGTTCARITYSAVTCTRSTWGYGIGIMRGGSIVIAGGSGSLPISQPNAEPNAINIPGGSLAGDTVNVFISANAGGHTAAADINYAFYPTDATPDPDPYPPPPALAPPTGFVGPSAIECVDIEDVCTALTELKGDLRIMSSMVTLIQRQKVPFAHMPGASFAGLSGTGQITVQGILGVVVTLTTIPIFKGSAVGTPTVRHDVGWINFGDASGWGPRNFVTHTPYEVLGVEGSVTKVGYSFPPGVVATIQVLNREG